MKLTPVVSPAASRNSNVALSTPDRFARSPSTSPWRAPPASQRRKVPAAWRDAAIPKPSRRRWKSIAASRPLSGISSASPPPARQPAAARTGTARH
ncbi:hypothetical protein [Burkholderia plantarii]|uniref:hypothetical protein n=1 Tax=Burkholderia plantarii TaxID=41899 RepID=UPI0011DFEAA3|nr:hypothetical protein [Burkholderia plantarii]